MSLLFVRKYLKIIYVLALPVYFYVSYNSILNKHSHVDANGIVITHSHPTGEAENQSSGEHGHSKKEICLYQILNFDYFVVSEEIQVTMIDGDIGQAKTERKKTIYSYLKISPSSPRAPPALTA